jgi:hypothetical protein
VAWENGVLAGLVDAIGFEPASARVIVGTSAGSSVSRKETVQPPDNANGAPPAARARDGARAPRRVTSRRT